MSAVGSDTVGAVVVVGVGAAVSADGGQDRDVHGRPLAESF